MSRNYDIYIDYGSGYELIQNEAIQEVKPINKKREKTEMYTRLELGEITLRNIPSYKIYDIIDNLEYDADEIKIKVIGFGLEVIGYFGKNDCEFDDNRHAKSIKIKPAIDDNYRRFLEAYEQKINITTDEISKLNVFVDIKNQSLRTIAPWFYREKYGKKELRDSEWDDVGGIEGFFNDNESPNLTLLDSEEVKPYDPFGKTLQNLIDIYSEQYYELSKVTVWRGSSWLDALFRTIRVFYVTCEFSREAEFVANDPPEQGGAQQYPPGGSEAGWEQVGDEYLNENAGSGGQWGYFYARIPFNGAYSDDTLYWSESPKVTNDGTNGGADFYWNEAKTTTRQYPGADGVTTTINTSFSLQDALTYMYQNLHDDLSTKQVKSTFFWNDDEDSLDFMDGNLGNNYVTNLPNVLNNLRLIHTNTLKTETQDNEDDLEDASLKTTIKKMIEELRRYWPVFYFVDDDLNLWIEHIKHCDLVKTVENLTGKNEIIHTKKYNFDKSILFDTRIINQINAGYVDFTDNEITFPSIVSNNRNQDLVLEEQTELISTDLRYCLENPNNLDNGLVMVVTDNSLNVLNQIAPISGTEQVNGYLAISNLLVDYWTYEGVYTNGQINGTDYVFQQSFRSKLGTELKFKGIIDSLFYNSLLGEGLFEEGSFDLENEGITTLKLRHRYNSSPFGDQEFLSYEETVTDGEFEGIYDLENSEL